MKGQGTETGTGGSGRTPADRSELSRRDFLRVGVSAGGGLLLAVHLPGVPGLDATDLSNGDSSAAAGAEPFAPNVFLRIDPDGTITIVVPRPEMGQGVRTSLPMLIAEELDVDLTEVWIQQAELDERYGGQYVGGSNSVRRSWEPLRRAGAAGRAMLVAAAADRWGVDPAACETGDGRVRHPRSGRVAGYGSLAAPASRLPVPEDPPLKDPADFHLIGRPTRHLDTPEIVRGRARFGLDVTMPGLLRAAVARAPVFGARVRSHDASAARAVPGVVDVIPIDADAWPEFPPNSPKPPNGVAVLAESTWAAFRGREALRVDWEPGPAADESTDAFWNDCERLAARPPERVLRDDGDVEAALRNARRRIEAVYRVPFLAHAPMEPMNCTAVVRDGACEIRAPTQNPADVRTIAARVTGLAPEAVAVRPERMGGAFGRRFYSDFVAEAAYLASRVDAPVQVVWTREDDTRHDLYRPAGYHRMRAGLDPDDRVTAWWHHLVNASRYDHLRREGAPGDGELNEFKPPAEFVENLRLSYRSRPSPIPRGQWRAIASSANVFVVESFVDELAHVAGVDPLDFRLELIGPGRAVPYYSRTYDSGRLRGVIEQAADRADWGARLPDGHGRGIAASYANGAFVAHVAETSVDVDGRPRIHRVVSAVDPGRVVNPNGVRAQVEGSIAYGLSAALHESITVENGRVVPANFDTYPVLQIDGMPEVEVEIVEVDAPPDGMGEGALPALAPAVTNALFDATGVRVRRLPIGTIDVRDS